MTYKLSPKKTPKRRLQICALMYAFSWPGSLKCYPIVKVMLSTLLLCSFTEFPASLSNILDWTFITCERIHYTFSVAIKLTSHVIGHSSSWWLESLSNLDTMSERNYQVIDVVIQSKGLKTDNDCEWGPSKPKMGLNLQALEGFHELLKTILKNLETTSYNLEWIQVNWPEHAEKQLWLIYLCHSIMTVERISTYKLVNTRKKIIMNQIQPGLSSQPHLER